MTDDTLVNGLKAIFGTSAQGSAPASSALIPYMDSSGNPVGLSSMSNLASVLGGLRIVTSITDLNAVDYSCASTINGATVSNTPMSGWGSFICIKGSSYISQLFLAGSNNALYYRTTNTGPWVRSYDETILTDSAILSPLASALGGLNNTIASNYVTTDISDCYPTEARNVSFFRIDTGATGLPSGSRNGYAISGRWGSGFYGYIIYIDAESKKVFYCVCESNSQKTFTPWKEFAMDIPSFYKDYTDLNALATALKAIW